MTVAEQSEQTKEQQTQGGNGSSAGKTALRTAAIAAATGATAIAAKRAFSDRQQGSPSKQRNGGSGEESLLGGMLGSGWHAAKDSLVPFAEDAAKAAGEYLASSGPEVVRETIVPSFIEGFEGSRQSGGE
jgi:hypothetical protein